VPKVMESSIIIQVLKVLGVSQPFSQGGSWRVTIPKEMVKLFNLESEEETTRFIFLKTDKGVLIVPLQKLVTPEAIKESLG